MYNITTTKIRKQVENLNSLHGRHDIQHNDTHHNDTHHNDNQHNDTQHNDTQHNDTQHNNKSRTFNRLWPML